MKRLEDELKNALRRSEPPEDFADRVLLRIREEGPRTRRGFFLRPKPCWWAFAGIILLLAASGGVHHRAREERRRGEEAKEQLMMALRIAGGGVRLAQEKIQERNARWMEQGQEDED